MRGKHEQRSRSFAGRRLPVIIFAGVVLSLVIIALAAAACAGSTGARPESRNDQGPTPAAEPAPPPAPSESPDLTPAPAPEPEPEPPEACRFPLTPEERDLTERVVMAEAGGESFEGQMAVAQCILNACEKTGGQPSEVILAYQYAKPAEIATQSVRDAVAAVFDDGDTVTTEPIMFFYAPRWTDSEWHETQRFVMEIGGHRFFAEKGANQ